MDLTSDYSIVATSPRDQSQAVLKFAIEELNKILSTLPSSSSHFLKIEKGNWVDKNTILLRGTWRYTGDWGESDTEEYDETDTYDPADYFLEDLSNKIEDDLRKAIPSQLKIISLSLDVDSEDFELFIRIKE